MTMKQQLIDQVSMDARWREGSNRFRHDPRYARATAACHEIIRYLEGLPDDDPRLERLEAASDGYIRDPDHNEGASRSDRVRRWFTRGAFEVARGVRRKLRRRRREGEPMTADPASFQSGPLIGPQLQERRLLFTSARRESGGPE